MRGTGESLRSTFLRARDCGALDEIPGLVYSHSTARNGVPEELVDTGVQRLLGNLNELPHATLGYRLLEPPGKGPALQSGPVVCRETVSYPGQSLNLQRTLLSHPA